MIVFLEFSGDLLYKGDGYCYYKVPVANGVKLIEGAVPDTCQAAGLEAVCAGANCPWRSSRCKNVPLSVQGDCACAYLDPISKLICNGAKAGRCPKLDRVFSSITNWQDSEWGIVDGKHCEAGSAYTSTIDSQLYAYCVKAC